MGGSYEFYQGLWLWHGPQGQTRFASADEIARINAAFPNGAPAHFPDTHLPAPPPTVGTPYVHPGPPADSPEYNAAKEQLMTPGTTPGDPAPPPPPSYDPVGGPNAPTFTPGMVFGQGVIPGQGQGGSPYQRQWFDVGGDPNKETVNNAFYNNPSNWDVAWQKAINQFGGTPGSAYGDFLNSWSTTGQREFNNIAPYDPNVNVADFVDAYAPQLKGVFGLMSPANRGQRGSVTGFDRAAY